MHSNSKLNASNKWRVGLALATIVWSVLPTLIGEAVKLAGHILVGTSALNPTDAVVYQSYIEQGRHGSWWMHDWFTSEHTAATIWQPLWLVIGRLAEWFHLSAPAAYFLTRILGAIILSLAVAWTVRWLFPKIRTQRWAAALVLSGSGIGWLWALITQPKQLVTSAPDFWVAEMYPVLSFLTGPHFLIITAALLLTFVSVERYGAERHPRFLLTAIVSGLVLFSLHPFHALLLVAVWISITLWRWRAGERIRSYVVGWGAVLITNGPIILLYATQVLTDPLTSGRAAQNIAETWPIAMTIIALGGFLGLALWSRPSQWPRANQWRWLVAWAVMGTALLYFPISFQRRLSQALIIPFVLLSVPVFIDSLEKIKKYRARRAILIGAMLCLCASGLVSLGISARGYIIEARGANAYNLYLSSEQQKIYQTIQVDQNPDHAVLGSITTSQFVPAFAHHRVFIGHSVETIQFVDKQKVLGKFYAAFTEGEQRDFLKTWNICWAIHGPREKAYGSAFEPDGWKDLRAVWRGPTTVLYYRTSCD